MEGPAAAAPIERSARAGAQSIQSDSRATQVTGAPLAWPIAGFCRKHPLESPLGIWVVHAFTVSGLKHNPAEALRQARSSPVVVLNRNNPDAVLIGLEEGGLLQAPDVRAALATALFRDGELSLVRAAHVAEMDVASFIAHLGRLGIAAIRLTAEETHADLDTLEQWLQSSLPPPIRSSPPPVR